MTKEKIVTTSLPNNVDYLCIAIENDYEIYGYSEYGFDGRPKTVELKKIVKN